MPFKEDCHEVLAILLSERLAIHDGQAENFGAFENWVLPHIW